MKNLVVILSLIVASMCIGCAPMPGNTLFEGLNQATELSTIENFRVVIDPLETTKVCNELAWQTNKNAVVANCLFNGCIVAGCANVKWDDQGHIYECTVYAALDVDWIIEHEKRHCMGYTDDLY